MTNKNNRYTGQRLRVALIFSVTLIVVVAPLTYSTIVAADTLIIPEISSQPPNTRDSVLRPVRSMTMHQVRAKFGEPQEVIAPIGNPPITRWVYEQFVVHFEHNYVIHSVVKK